MPYGSITLKPGVNTQQTPSLNEAGVSQSQLIRYKDGMIQSYGGWETVPITSPSTVRAIHAWQGIGNSHPHLALAGTTSLLVFHSDDNAAETITPQTNTTNPPPNFSVSSGSDIVTVVDGGSSASVYNTVYFNTPVALGGLLLNGAYQIKSILGSSIYTIQVPTVSSATVASSGKLPIFNTSSGSPTVTVTLSNNGFQAITGLFQQFIAPTSVGGLTIQGKYKIASVIDSTDFTINATTQSSATATATMNSSLAQLVYYITLGPAATGSGFGSGGFGLGSFGSGTGSIGVPGTPITTTDWTLDNWGELLIACPKDGPIYTWSTDSGYQNGQVIATAPFFNGGIFVSMPQQILVAWRSIQSSGVQDPLVVRWSDAGDYTNWTVSNQTQAGSFHIPTGSTIVGGIQGPTYALISTDIDAWIMQYVGGDVTFNFTKIGTGCGWIGPHACGVLSNNFYWCGLSNFYTIGPNGVQSLPCSVWDYIFQNLNASFQDKVFCAINSSFNEIAWFFPSTNSLGECDSYVKAIFEGGHLEWDYGLLSRTAWIDISVLGQPIGADASGAVWQHETGVIHAGAGSPSFTTGWWAISEGNDFSFVDFVIPDFIWGTQSGTPDAQMNITFYSADYPGDTPRTYGPYTVTQATQYINTRIRGRLMSAQITSANEEFWRLGKIRFRFAIAGRR